MTIADLPEAWTEPIEALTLLVQHSSNDTSPLHCAHDELTVMVNPATVSRREMVLLAGLGFMPNETDQTFTSFRFRSA